MSSIICGRWWHLKLVTLKCHDQKSRIHSFSDKKKAENSIESRSKSFALSFRDIAINRCKLAILYTVVVMRSKAINYLHLVAVVLRDADND